MKRITLHLAITSLIIFSFSCLAQASMTMYLSPSSQAVGVGDTFDLEVGLNNPDSIAFDTLSFWITFDPTKLAVQDTDTDNWINTGINVLDGLYHTTYPFNVHFQNSADNTSGDILYNEGILPSTLSGSGTFARITFLALAMTPFTSIDFNFDWGQLNDTYVVNSGVDVLGSSLDHTDGAIGADITIIPEPGSLVLLGAGLMGMVALRNSKRKKEAL